MKTTKIKIEGMNKQEKTSAKTGKTFTTMGILAKDTNGKDQWINGFYDESMASWQKGDEVELVIFTDTYVGKDGQQRTALKFKKVPVESRLDDIERRLSDLENKPSQATQVLPNPILDKGGEPFDAVNLESNEDVPF